MKIKLLFIPILLLAFACQNTPKETTEQAQENTETTENAVMANTQKVELSISGMTCTGCESAVQETIDAFDGVYSSKADHEKGIAILELDSTKVDMANIKVAINDLGYEAADHVVLAE
jgi:copper chaperone CopZ